MKFSERLKEFYLYAKDRQLFDEHSRIIVALSGGADSMVLLYFLHRLCLEGRLSAVHAFHLNHSLRDVADSEQGFVERYCRENDIPLTVKKEDIRNYAEVNRISEETAGRKVRYSYLRELKDSLGYDLIATAHHADDNAETIIMRLTRGTALKGLGGIHPKQDDIIRPVLYLTKDEIYNICEEENIPYVTDMSNFDNNYFRNRIRNTVIPQLKKDNPSFSGSVLRTTEIMRDAWDYISKIVDSVNIVCDKNRVSCTLADIESCDDYIVSQVILRMCGILTGADNVGYSHVKKLTALLRGNDKRWEYHLPSIRAVCADGMFYVTSETGKKNKKEEIIYRYDIIPGIRTEIPEAGIAVETEIIKKNKNFVINNYIKAVDYDRIKGKLFVTPREDGMKFRPVGRNMTKAVNKYMSDMKIPMHERDITPILRTEEGIVSVGTYETDERYMLTEKTENILLIKISDL